VTESGTVYPGGEKRGVLSAFPGLHGFMFGKEFIKKLR